ncbi:MAG: DUF2721 domain-containing protein [Candidatus Nezhaarchaeota archaeon]|nr:DUF2721 domain-containing protein [Candidatus Nezhaarchaeota archaeon]
MEIQNVISVLQSTLTPVVMISALGLLCIVIQTRYGRVVDIMMRLSSEKRRIQYRLARIAAGYEKCQDTEMFTERLKVIEAQMDILVKRGSLVKWSMFTMFFAILCFILTSFLIWLGQTAMPVAAVNTATLGAFYLGMILAFSALMLILKDVLMTYKGMLIEARKELQR